MVNLAGPPFLLLNIFITVTTTEWIHDDVNGVWAYEHPTDKILAMLFAPQHQKDTGKTTLLH